MDTRAVYEEQLYPVVREVERALASCPDLDPEFSEMYSAAVGGGMRFRPCLMHMAFAMCGGDIEEVLIPAAVAVELLHKASLLHDDLIDGDALRRGVPSFCHVYGSQKTVIMGDLLVARAYRALDVLGDLVPREVSREAQRRFASAHYEMCRGELLELIPCEGAPTLERATRVLKGKTASLMEQSMAMGAVLGGGSQAEVDALGKYGRSIGLIFQTVNDMNNLTEFERDVKGAALSDLRGRRVGFPMVGLAMHLGEERLIELSDQSHSGIEEAEDVERELQSLMESGPVREWLDSILADLQQESIEALSVFPPSFERNALEAVGREMFESWFWRPNEGDEERK